MTDLKDYLRVGVITSPHGVHGEVNVFPTTDDVERFKDLTEVLMVGPKTEKLLHAEGVKYFKNMVILKFKEFNTMNDVETLRMYDLYVDREHAVPLKENEYYIADLLGMDVLTDTDRKLGKVKDIMQTGANAVYVVEMPDHKEVLIPNIKQCILDISLEKRQVLVHLLPGLLEE